MRKLSTRQCRKTRWSQEGSLGSFTGSNDKNGFFVVELLCWQMLAGKSQIIIIFGFVSSAICLCHVDLLCIFYSPLKV